MSLAEQELATDRHLSRMFPTDDYWINVPDKEGEKPSPTFKFVSLDDDKAGKNNASSIEKVSNDIAALTKSTSIVKRSQDKVKHFLWLFSLSNIICYILVFVLFCIFFLAIVRYESEIHNTNRLLQKQELYYNTSIEMFKINSAIIKFLGFLMYISKDEPPRSTNFENMVEINGAQIEKIKKALLMDALVSRLNPVIHNMDVDKLNLTPGVEVQGPNAPLKDMIESISYQASDNKIILLLGDIDLAAKMGVQIGDNEEKNISYSHQFQVLQILDDDGLFVKFQALNNPEIWPNMAIFCLLDTDSHNIVGYYQVQKGSIMEEANGGAKILHFGTFVLGSSDFTPFAKTDNTLRYAFILFNDDTVY